jgi:hypothetical protein
VNKLTMEATRSLFAYRAYESGREAVASNFLPPIVVEEQAKRKLALVHSVAVILDYQNPIAEGRWMDIIHEAAAELG